MCNFQVGSFFFLNFGSNISVRTLPVTWSGRVFFGRVGSVYRVEWPVVRSRFYQRKSSSERIPNYFQKKERIPKDVPWGLYSF